MIGWSVCAENVNISVLLALKVTSHCEALRCNCSRSEFREFVNTHTHAHTHTHTHMHTHTHTLTHTHTHTHTRLFQKT